MTLKLEYMFWGCKYLWQQQLLKLQTFFFYFSVLLLLLFSFLIPKGNYWMVPMRPSCSATLVEPVCLLFLGWTSTVPLKKERWQRNSIEHLWKLFVDTRDWTLQIYSLATRPPSKYNYLRSSECTHITDTIVSLLSPHHTTTWHLV